MRRAGDTFDISERRGNLCTVRFYLDVTIYDTESGEEYDMKECSLTALYFDGIEENIRRNFSAWVAHALSFEQERRHLRAAAAALEDMAVMIGGDDR